VRAPYESRLRRDVDDASVAAVHSHIAGEAMETKGCAREHLERLYSILDGVRCRSGIRTLADSGGGMGWPRRGVYFFFEPGEHRAAPNGGAMRVVRVGTHAVSAGSKTTLWDRLRQHRGTGTPGGQPSGGNHRGSIFRKHVGGALLRAERYAGEGADTWGEGQSAVPEVTAREVALERAVSSYIGAMPFVWIEADDDPGPTSIRAQIEQGCISLLSAAVALDPASSGWLGHHARDEAIRSSGLWNVRHVGGVYAPAFLDVLERCANGGANAALTTIAAAPRLQPATGVESQPPASGVARTDRSSVFALVSCTKLKALGVCRAADLYRRSPLFRGAWEYAGRVAGHRMILSAKYGLLRPDTLVSPYEQTLATAGRAERDGWAARVHVQLRAAPEYREANTVVWLAGEAYRDALLPLVEREGKRCEVPMRGLTQGQQLSWLNAQRSGRTAALPTPARGSDPELVAMPVAGVHRHSEQGAPARRSAAPRAEDFRAELRQLLAEAKRQSRSVLVVSAGQLHRLVGGYPGQHHRMPICCSVMRSEMRPGDAILAAPPKGQGASLEISYRTSR
jgi:hypothetical protein